MNSVAESSSLVHLSPSPLVFLLLFHPPSMYLPTPRCSLSLPSVGAQIDIQVAETRFLGRFSCLHRIRLVSRRRQLPSVPSAGFLSLSLRFPHSFSCTVRMSSALSRLCPSYLANPHLCSRESVPSSKHHLSSHPALFAPRFSSPISFSPPFCLFAHPIRLSVTPVRIPNVQAHRSVLSCFSLLAPHPPLIRGFLVLLTSHPITHISSRTKDGMASLARLPPLVELVTRLSSPPSLPHSLNLLHLLIAPFLLSPHPNPRPAAAPYEHILSYYGPGASMTHFVVSDKAGGSPGGMGHPSSLARPHHPLPLPEVVDGRSGNFPLAFSDARPESHSRRDLFEAIKYGPCTTGYDPPPNWAGLGGGRGDLHLRFSPMG